MSQNWESNTGLRMWEYNKIGGVLLPGPHSVNVRERRTCHSRVNSGTILSWECVSLHASLFAVTRRHDVRAPASYSRALVDLCSNIRIPAVRFPPTSVLICPLLPCWLVAAFACSACRLAACLPSALLPLGVRICLYGNPSGADSSQVMHYDRHFGGFACRDMVQFLLCMMRILRSMDLLNNN